MNIVGRTQELKAITEAVRELGSAAFVTIHGEPGIGKTRLLRELADVARAHGVPVDDGMDIPRPPVVMLADDLDDADAETLETLARLLRTPPRGGVLIALAYRRLPAALFSALEAATRRGLARRPAAAPARTRGRPPATAPRCSASAAATRSTCSSSRGTRAACRRRSPPRSRASSRA